MGRAVDDALRVIWESLDYICAERLTPALVLTAQQLVAHGELVVTDALLAQLRHHQRCQRPAAADPLYPGYAALAAPRPDPGQSRGARHSRADNRLGRTDAGPF